MKVLIQYRQLPASSWQIKQDASNLRGKHSPVAGLECLDANSAGTTETGNGKSTMSAQIAQEGTYNKNTTTLIRFYTNKYLTS
jgi:hypothetical protein